MPAATATGRLEVGANGPAMLGPGAARIDRDVVGGGNGLEREQR